jgi:hypothetical protein
VCADPADQVLIAPRVTITKADDAVSQHPGAVRKADAGGVSQRPPF